MRFVRFRILGCFVASLAFLMSPTSQAQNDSWTGSDSTNLWTDGNNWSLSAPPTSANVAYFNGAGNGQTTIDLSGTTQTVGALQFDTNAAAAYTLGVSTGDTLDIANNNNGTGVGAISVIGTVANAQAVNAAIAFLGTAPTITDASSTGPLTLGSSSSPSTLTTATGTTAFVITASGGSTITINDVISGPVGGTTSGATATGGLQLQTATGTSPTGTIAFNAQNTYTGLTNLNATSGGLIVQIGSSTDTASSATYTKGPFGVGTIAFNGNGTQSFVQAVNADQTIANPYVFTAGETFNNAAIAHSLTLTGPGSFTGNSGRTLTFSNSSTTPMTFTFGSSSSPSTFSLASTTAVNVAWDVAQNNTLVLNDVIQNTGSATDTMSFNSAGNNTPQGVVLITGANTYSGTTTIAGQTSGTLSAQTTQIGVSSVGSPGSITSGPFGKNTLIFNGNASAPPIVQPFGADRTVANAVTMTSGFLVNNPTSAQDPSGAHNLTFTGPISNSSGKTLTNNLAVGVALTFGSTGSPSTISMGSAGMTIQNTAGTNSATIINDLISGTTLPLTLKNNGTVYLNNTGNTYSAGTNVIGTGTLGSGATLAGTGNAGTGGTVTISSLTASSQGGIISPGSGTAPGTITVPSMMLDPSGRYVFEYNGNDNTTGSGVNDLISSTAGSLNLAALPGSSFDLDLVPTTGTASSTPLTYTIASFGGGITGGSGDITTDFTFSGSYNNATAPDVQVSGNNLILTFTPTATPEPSSLMLVGAAFSILGLRRKRQ